MIPTRIGQICNGGTFAGFNRVCNRAYAIVFAHERKAMGSDGFNYKTNRTATLGSQSTVDGASNTAAMDSAKHPAAAYCKNLTANGFTDWHLPSLNELELWYRNLKPSADKNNTTSEHYRKGNLALANGENLSSIPVGMPYTDSVPTKTIVTRYINNNLDKYSCWHWSSTEYSPDSRYAVCQNFLDGKQYPILKNDPLNVWAVRRVLIAQTQENPQ